MLLIHVNEKKGSDVVKQQEENEEKVKQHIPKRKVTLQT